MTKRKPLSLLTKVLLFAGAYFALTFAAMQLAKAELEVGLTPMGYVIYDPERPDCFLQTGSEEATVLMFGLLTGEMTWDEYFAEMEKLVGAPPPEGYHEQFREMLKPCGYSAQPV